MVSVRIFIGWGFRRPTPGRGSIVAANSSSILVVSSSRLRTMIVDGFGVGGGGGSVVNRVCTKASFEIPLCSRNLFAPSPIGIPEGLSKLLIGSAIVYYKQNKGELANVGVKGIGPSASRSRTERSTDELHPGYYYFTIYNE